MRFFNPVEINQSAGIRKDLVSICKDKSSLVVCSKSFYKRGLKDKYLAELFNNSSCFFEHNFNPNPSLEEICFLNQKYSKSEFKLILGIGGGSAMDVSKMLSIGIPAYKNGITIKQLIFEKDFFRRIKKIDTILIPTTAGTGSEVTPFATVWDYSKNLKLSLSNEKLYAVKVYLDNDLLKSIPIEIALSTGLDALNQAFESIWNKNANFITNQYAIKAINLSLKSLNQIENIKTSESVRENLMNASLISGIAISQTKTSICHAISYPITLNLKIPHGLACAFSMREVLNFNYDLIKDQLKNIENLKNLDEIDKIIENIFIKYNYKNIIRKYVKNEDEILNLIDEMKTTGRFENNIRFCSDKDLLNIISKSCKFIFT